MMEHISYLLLHHHITTSITNIGRIPCRLKNRVPTRLAPVLTLWLLLVLLLLLILILMMIMMLLVVVFYH